MDCDPADNVDSPLARAVIDHSLARFLAALVYDALSEFR